MSTAVITTDHLTLHYGKNRGIEDVSLTVQAGEVFGFLGPNGAGKTTTLRILLDLIRPAAGTARIFGRDCQKDGPAIRARVGYLPGELNLYRNLTGREFLNMLVRARAAHIRSGDLDALITRLDYDPSRPIRQLSRGNKQKLGLIAAFLHHPELLILDEPTSGLDPLVQHTVNALVREARAEGRTVFFSSHILPEVQAVADRIAIIRNGKIVAVETVAALIARKVRRLTVTFAASPPTLTLPGVSEVSRTATTLTLDTRPDALPALFGALSSLAITDIESPAISLEDAFFALYGGQP